MDFSKDALNDARKQTDLEGELNLRRDLRSIPCVTIDPEMARDHDDAVAIDRTEEDGYRLYVHIADVSHYVGEQTALDREASQSRHRSSGSTGEGALEDHLVHAVRGHQRQCELQ